MLAVEADPAAAREVDEVQPLADQVRGQLESQNGLSLRELGLRANLRDVDVSRALVRLSAQGRVEFKCGSAPPARCSGRWWLQW
jgi:hypothetical protein